MINYIRVFSLELVLYTYVSMNVSTNELNERLEENDC